MMNINYGEIAEAVKSLGRGNHKLKAIENEMERLRHLQVKLNKKTRRKKK